MPVDFWGDKNMSRCHVELSIGDSPIGPPVFSSNEAARSLTDYRNIYSSERVGCPKCLMTGAPHGAGVTKRNLVIKASDDGRTHTGP